MAKEEITLDAITNKLSMIVDLLNENQRSLFLESIKVQYLRKNELVYKDGDMPRDMICVISGKLKIFKEGVTHYVVAQNIMPSIRHVNNRCIICFMIVMILIF